jgi:hypothetical protein
MRQGLESSGGVREPEERGANQVGKEAKLGTPVEDSGGRKNEGPAGAENERPGGGKEEGLAGAKMRGRRG